MTDTSGMSLALNAVLFLPVAGMLLLLLVPANKPSLTRAVTLTCMLVQLALTAWLYFSFDSNTSGLQFETRIPWIGQWGVYYHIGLDGLNVLLVLMTAFLAPLIVAGAFSAIQKDVKLFYAMVLLIQFAMMGTFLAQDLFLFYLFWEFMLIPMFLMIGIWGGERRIYATIKFVLYTAFGSILMLAAMIYLVYNLQQTSGVVSFAFTDLYKSQLPVNAQALLLGAFGLAFAIKVPVFPFHTWLPDAHVEAPTPGSVILAGVMLKMGTYGFMRLGFPLFPQATVMYTPFLMTLAVISIVYGACLALVQNDIKKIIAYSSISHLGYVMLGLLSLDMLGIQGAIVQMVSHGLVAAGLFLMIGMIYERTHTRDLAAYGGLAKLLPVYSVFFMILTLASVGLPTTSGFTGEFMVLMGAFKSGWTQHLAGSSYQLVLASVAVTGVILGALYMLRFALGFLWGAERAQGLPFGDLNAREKSILGAIVAAVFALGLFPNSALQKSALAAREFQHRVATSGGLTFDVHALSPTALDGRRRITGATLDAGRSELANIRDVADRWRRLHRGLPDSNAVIVRDSLLLFQHGRFIDTLRNIPGSANAMISGTRAANGDPIASFGAANVVSPSLRLASPNLSNIASPWPSSDRHR